MADEGYVEYDSVKIKLRIDDDSMSEEIKLYMAEVNNLINSRLRARLGEINIYGEPITLPLSVSTIPAINLELKGIASDLVVAKIRLQNSEKPLLWDAEVQVLDNFLDQVYGWVSDRPFQPQRTLTATPRTGIIGATVTMGGTNFKPYSTLRFIFDSTEPTTTPAVVTTDGDGVFSGVTFTIPANQPDGGYEIKVNDPIGGLAIGFTVTS